MVLRIVLAVIFLAGGATCAAAASLQLMRLADDVNKALPSEHRINPYFWHPGKYLRLREAYDRVYPGRYPPKRLVYLWIGMGASFVGMAVTLLTWSAP